MDWLFGDDEECKEQTAAPDYTTLEGILRLPVADPFEKWPEDQRNSSVCPERLSIHDNRFRLLGKKGPLLFFPISLPNIRPWASSRHQAGLDAA